MRRAALIAALLLVSSGRATGAHDEPSLKEVVRRMGAYVQAYGEKASILVATERYTQDVKRIGPPVLGPLDPDHRVTVADFAIVKIERRGGWIGFRDVIEVDGRSLTDRKERLLDVLRAASGAMDEATRLSAESARFNIGPIFRDFNVPTSALFFFIPENLDRFKFSRKTVAPDGTWEIAFRETERPTLVRTPRGVSVPSEGTLWVNAATGTVVRTRVEMTGFGTPRSGRQRGSGYAEIDVAYRLVPALDMWLPDRMTETYAVGPERSADRTTTEARYTDYRQFQTSVRIK
jgi:hypothetical protein